MFAQPIYERTRSNIFSRWAAKHGWPDRYMKQLFLQYFIFSFDFSVSFVNYDHFIPSYSSKRWSQIFLWIAKNMIFFEVSKYFGSHANEKSYLNDEWNVLRRKSFSGETIEKLKALVFTKRVPWIDFSYNNNDEQICFVTATG